LGDIKGRREVFALGEVVFILASVVAGSSQSAQVLIAARLTQGVGAAMILPTTLSTMNAIFRGRERNIAFAVYGSTIGGMAAVGPLVGGWLATDVSWRWAFWLNIPFGLLVLLGIMRFIPETRDPSVEHHLDLVGATLSALAMAGLVFALIEGAYYGWWRQSTGALSPVPVAAAVGALALTLFFVREARARAAGQPTVIDLGLLALPTLRYGIIAAMIVAFGEFGLLFTLPLLLEGTLGYSALGAGWMLVALAVGAFLVSAVTPQLTRALGQRAVVRIGLALEAVGVAALALTLSVTVPGAVLAACLFGYGVGVGMATAQLSSLIMSEVPPAAGGQASGLQSTVRQLGSALGIAVLGTLLVTSLGTGTESRLADAGMPSAARTAIVELVRGSAGAGIPALDASPATRPAAAAAREAMVDASRTTTGFAAAALLLGLLATLAIPKVPQPHTAD
jgi:EmrB/QacA subfamily drug resistance transporter